MKPRKSSDQEVIATASAILAGDLGVIEGSRLLSALGHRVCSSGHDADFLPFVGIDSETDHLPIGPVRQHWNSEALASKDVEIQAAEDHWRNLAFSASRRLLDRFDGKPYEAEQR